MHPRLEIKNPAKIIAPQKDECKPSRQGAEKNISLPEVVFSNHGAKGNPDQTF
jgi:hypothetical protein